MYYRLFSQILLHRNVYEKNYQQAISLNLASRESKVTLDMYWE